MAIWRRGPSASANDGVTGIKLGLTNPVTRDKADMQCKDMMDSLQYAPPVVRKNRRV